MSMTPERARQIVDQQQTGAKSLEATLELYEALLLVWGLTDDDRRKREVERFRGLLTEGGPRTAR